MFVNRLSTLLIASIFVLISILTNATEPPYVPGEVLVQTLPGKNITEVVRGVEYVNGVATGVYVKKKVSEPMHVWLLGFDGNAIADKQFLNAVKTNSAVSVAQFNHYIQNRATVPNDSQFGQQWQYVNTGQNGGTVDADIDADEAWDVTTGGLTALGDTIVVCVVDDGIDVNHSDFGNNMWINHAEIPNNNIDDDNNGYVDDYLGWNADDDNDDITGGFFGGGHGTPVAGIMGAKGNNGNGVTGVNWDVKLMIVVGGGNEAQAVEAYTYPLVMRKRYNQSGGTEGAFVVVTNSSWGINNGQPSNAPLWCAMYDSLGAAGVLSAGATANANFDIDVTGDLPTACPSDYLISVTNTSRNDIKLTQAGYGLTTIDLGAPGQDTYTPQEGGGYGNFGGTSGATPHVAGTVGLLYSAPCYSFAVMAHADPAGAALAVKNYIMDGVDPNASLDNITVTGGRLNTFGALTGLLNNCATGGCVEPFSLTASNIGVDSAVVSWLGAPSANTFVLEYRLIGALNWTTISNATSPYTLNNLLGCANYEFHVLAQCDNDTSLFSSVYTFTTDECCEAPTGFQAGVSGVDGGSAVWDEVADAVSYNVRIRPVGTNNWDIQNTGDEVMEYTGLDHCTEYEVQVQTVCDTSSSPYTSSIIFQTGDCDCDEAKYCISAGTDSDDEWIGYVGIGDIANSSGNDNGYADYSNYSTDLHRDASYEIKLMPDYPTSTTYTERFRVWIDWNRNGVFDDPSERVYTSVGATDTVTGNITVPANASVGTTGMRVSMQYQSAPSVCSTGANFDFGEVEDYCVNIIDTINSVMDDEWQNSVLVYPNPFGDRTTVTFVNTKSEVVTINLMDASGRLLRTLSTTSSQLIVERQGLTPGLYIFELSSGEGKTHRGKLIIR